MALHKVKFSVPPTIMDEYTINPASLATLVSADQTVTIKGVRPGQMVLVNAVGLEAGLILSNAHVSAADTVKFRIYNSSDDTVDSASQVFRIVVF